MEVPRLLAAKNKNPMDNIFYYVAIVLTLGLVVFGIVYVALAAYGFARGVDSATLPNFRSLMLSRFLSGIANILIGGTLYWHVNESMTSTVLVSLTVSAFALWEWFARTYFIEKTDSNVRL